MHQQQTFFTLQVCRGVAALSVMLCHTSLITGKNVFNGYFRLGWVGVDLFFVMSGFIIYYTSSKYFGHPEKITVYLQRRFLRIYPVYWIYATGVLLIHFTTSNLLNIKLISWMELNPSNIARSLFLFPSDFHQNTAHIIPVAWSLCHEVLFYGIFALCILIPRLPFVFVISLWAILIGASYANILNNQYGNLTNVLLHPKNLEFIWGCIIAEVVLRGIVLKKNSTQLIAFLLGIFLLVVSLVNQYLHFPESQKMDAFYFGIPLAIIVYTLVSFEMNAIISQSSLAVYLGYASYSIYLTHFIAIGLLSASLHKHILNDSILFTIVFFVSLVLGCLSYNWIEKPLLDALKPKTLRK